MPLNNPTGLKIQEKFTQKKLWDSSKLKIALCYPNVYTIGMGGYTLQLLYALWNADERVICERAFLPFAAVQPIKGQDSNYDRIPPIRTLENQISLDQFDIVAFSVQFELNIPNLIWMLQNAHIPLIRGDRENSDHQSDSSWPLILMGGPVIRTNPVPLSSIIDLAFIGDFEPIIERVTTLWFDSQKKCAENNWDPCTQRQFIIDQIGKLPGMWNPKVNPATLPINVQIQRVYAKQLTPLFHPTSQIIPIFEDGVENPLPFGETLFLEINRGCPHGCRFCLTGQQNKPFRNRSLTNLEEIIRNAINETGIKHITLIGASIVDHPQFEGLCDFLEQNQITYSLPSIRIETITLEIAQKIVKNGTKTFTFAPECGSDGLRKRLNKCITNDQILKGCEILINAGIQNLKMYFLYGLPFETDEDLIAIPHLIQKIGQFKTGKESLRINLNPLIPKPHTPFESFIDCYTNGSKNELERRYNLITSPLKGNRQVKVDPFEFEESYLQTIFTLGDERITDLLVACSRTSLRPHSWFMLARRQYGAQIENLWSDVKRLPFGQHWWNILNQGFSARFLEDEWQRASEGKEGIHCREQCHACGVCDTDDESTGQGQKGKN